MKHGLCALAASMAAASVCTAAPLQNQSVAQSKKPPAASIKQLTKNEEDAMRRFIKDDTQRRQDRQDANRTRQAMASIYGACDQGERLVEEMERMIAHPDEYIRRYRIEDIDRKLGQLRTMPDSSAKRKAVRILRQMKERLEGGVQ